MSLFHIYVQETLGYCRYLLIYFLCCRFPDRGGLVKGGGGLQVSVSSGNVKNYMHAPRGLGGRRMKASERGSQASASKVVGWCVACRHSDQ